MTEAERRLTAALRSDMGKRVLLFLMTNLAIIITLSIVLQVLGWAGYVGPGLRLQLVPLAFFCLFWGMGGAFISLQLSRWMAKRAMGVGLVDGRTGQAELDWLYNAVENLTRQAELPMPEVGIYDSPEVNAFATGPSQRRSLVAVSTGLLRAMDRHEAEAVLAHEVSHIKNGDMVTMALLQGVMNAFVMFFARLIAWIVRQSIDSRAANTISFLVMIVLQIVLGILGSMVTAWFSRQREFRADSGAAALSGRQGMVSALRRLMQYQDHVDNSQPALASFKIAGRGGFMALVATHPPLEQRIAALESQIG
jgi:heat shock protein HtpX